MTTWFERLEEWKQQWSPASAEVRFESDDGYLDGKDWPDVVELVAWERNASGERRIKATRRYRIDKKADR